MSRRLTDLQLERLLAEAMSPAEKSAAEKVLAASPEDAEALRLLRAESEAFLFSQPPAVFAEKVMPTPKASGFRLWWGALVAVAAALVLVFVARPVEPEDDVRVKGDVAWKVSAESRGLSDGAVVHGGETLSFQVTAPGKRWVAVVSRAPDGWFVYVPTTEVASGVSVLPVGARLDEKVGAEALHLISSATAFDAETVRAKLAADQPAAGVLDERLGLIKQ